MVNMMNTQKVQLDGETLNIAQVISVAREGARVSLSPKAKEKVEKAAALVQEWTESGEVIYGVTTGFGPFSEVVISSDKVQKIQHNLIPLRGSADFDRVHY